MGFFDISSNIEKIIILENKTQVIFVFLAGGCCCGFQKKGKKGLKTDRYGFIFGMVPILNRRFLY